MTKAVPDEAENPITMTPVYQPSDLHMAALAAWELLGRATAAIEVPSEKDGPQAHPLAMTPQQRTRPPPIWPRT